MLLPEGNDPKRISKLSAALAAESSSAVASDLWFLVCGCCTLVSQLMQELLLLQSLPSVQPTKIHYSYLLAY